MIEEKLGFEDKVSMEMIKGFPENLSLITNVKLTLFGPDGKVKQLREIHNTIPTNGLGALMDQLLASPLYC
jgi:hypothetical protein